MAKQKKQSLDLEKYEQAKQELISNSQLNSIYTAIKLAWQSEKTSAIQINYQVGGLAEQVADSKGRFPEGSFDNLDLVCSIENSGSNRSRKRDLSVALRFKKEYTQQDVEYITKLRHPRINKCVTWTHVKELLQVSELPGPKDTSYTHKQKVMFWLEQAAKNGWTVSDMRKMIKSMLPEKSGHGRTHNQPSDREELLEMMQDIIHKFNAKWTNVFSQHRLLLLPTMTNPGTLDSVQRMNNLLVELDGGTESIETGAIEALGLMRKWLIEAREATQKDAYANSSDSEDATEVAIPQRSVRARSQSDSMISEAFSIAEP